MQALTYTRTIIESPYAGDVELNMRYLNICIRDSILNYREAPFASHMFYTGALDDSASVEREAGMCAGFNWHGVADRVVVYYDLGISNGMTTGIENAEFMGIPVTYRKLSLTRDDIMGYKLP